MKQKTTKQMWDELLEQFGKRFVDDYLCKIDGYATTEADMFRTPLEHWEDEMRKRHERTVQGRRHICPDGVLPYRL